MAVLGSITYRHGSGTTDNRRVNFYADQAVVVDIVSGENVSTINQACIYLEEQSTTQRAHSMGMASLPVKQAFSGLDTNLKGSIIKQISSNSSTWKISCTNEPGPRFEAVTSLTLSRRN